MVIIINQLRKPGFEYDASKLAILGNKITGQIRQKSKGKYIVNYKIQGKTLKIKLEVLNPETNKYVSSFKDEQELLAGRISNFLNDAGVSHKIQVK